MAQIQITISGVLYTYVFWKCMLVGKQWEKRLAIDNTNHAYRVQMSNLGCSEVTSQEEYVHKRLRILMPSL